MPSPPKYELGYVLYDRKSPGGFVIRYYPKHQPGKFDHDEHKLHHGSIVFKPESWGEILKYISNLEEEIKRDPKLSPKFIFLDED